MESPQVVKKKRGLEIFGSDPLTRFNYIISSILIILFLLHTLKHFIQKKKCKKCHDFWAEKALTHKQAPMIEWQGVKRDSPSLSPVKKSRWAGLPEKLISMFMSGDAGGGLFPVEKHFELCSKCYQMRRKKMLENLGYEKVMELKALASKTNKKEIDYDPDYIWTHKPDGIRYKVREWD